MYHAARLAAFCGCRYDPVHYGVPEGSYSTAPDGPMRVLEYREMVQVGAEGFGGGC
jgi:hypothetical protein